MGGLWAQAFVFRLMEWTDLVRSGGADIDLKFSSVGARELNAMADLERIGSVLGAGLGLAVSTEKVTLLFSASEFLLRKGALAPLSSLSRGSSADFPRLALRRLPRFFDSWRSEG